MRDLDDVSTYARVPVVRLPSLEGSSYLHEPGDPALAEQADRLLIEAARWADGPA